MHPIGKQFRRTAVALLTACAPPLSWPAWRWPAWCMLRLRIAALLPAVVTASIDAKLSRPRCGRRLKRLVLAHSSHLCSPPHTCRSRPVLKHWDRRQRAHRAVGSRPRVPHVHGRRPESSAPYWRVLATLCGTITAECCCADVRPPQLIIGRA